MIIADTKCVSCFFKFMFFWIYISTYKFLLRYRSISLNSCFKTKLLFDARLGFGLAVFVFLKSSEVFSFKSTNDYVALFYVV